MADFEIMPGALSPDQFLPLMGSFWQSMLVLSLMCSFRFRHALTQGSKELIGAQEGSVTIVGAHWDSIQKKHPVATPSSKRYWFWALMCSSCQF